MKIVFAADHAGFALKEVLVAFVRDVLAPEYGWEVEDLGAHTLSPEDDYPEIVAGAARAVAADPEDTRAIILGGSGQGEAMTANRFSGVRAAVYYGGALELVTLSREHNDANVLSLGARFLGEDEMREAVRLWLTTAFSDDARHIRRIRAIDTL